jgi:hypothetical protein
MKHDLNNAPSYEHMMGKEKRAHEGSQSKAPTSAKMRNEGLKDPNTMGTTGQPGRV